MKTYFWQGVDSNQQKQQGFIKAKSKHRAAKILTDNALDKVQVYKKSNKRCSNKDIKFFTSSLSTLLAAGLGLAEALKLLTTNNHNPALLQITENTLKSISSGNKLSTALESKGFPELYYNMVAAGEQSANLAKVFHQLSDYFARQEYIKKLV